MGKFDHYPFKTRPFDHQLKELEAHADSQAWAWLWDRGCGKSKLVIDNFCYLYLEKKIDTVVYISRAGDYANFYYDQLPSHLPDGLKTDILLYSGAKAKTKAFQAQVTRFMNPDSSRLRILVINLEALITDNAAIILQKLYRSSKAVFLALDESTCVKNISSKRAKEVYHYAAKSHYRRIMTGSPVTQSPLDLWGQSLVLRKGILGHNSFFSFRGDYAVMDTQYFGPRPVKTVTGYKNLDRLGLLLKTFSSQLTKEECLDLPPKIYTKLYVELTPEQEKLYSRLRDEAMLELEGQEVEVTSVLTQLVKLHQVACGQLKIDDETYKTIPNNRVKALLDTVEDYPGKVIIWATYRQTLLDVVQALTEQYGPSCVAGYYGGVSLADRTEAIKRFQDPKDPLKFFVANPQSGGFGLTLTEARLVIYYSNSFSLENRLQSEDRAHRIGQTEKVTYVDLVAKDTVDEKIIKVLREKKNVADVVMGQGWKSWL